jgi:BMFP domain-containing protein YqiC
MSVLFLVTATRDGYYGSYRKEGTVFEVDEEGFTDAWMTRGPVVTRERDRLEEMALSARAESALSGGANAALEIALADLRDAKAREAAQMAKIEELEARVAEKAAQVAELQGPAADDAPPADEGKQPEEAAPVTRVRRTTAE